MDEKILLKSKQKIVIIALIITILNPIFAGLIFSLFLRSEPQLKKEGQLLLILSLVWGGILFALSTRFSSILGL